jgi:hypothetical protein
MKKFNIALVAFCVFGFGTTLQAQNSISATGGNASGSGGTVSYSVGQVVFTTNTGTTGSVVQGVQLPFEISIVTGFEEATRINLMVSASPNPITDFLTLKVDASVTLLIQSISYQLFDMSGKLLENKKIDGNQTNIIMSNRMPSTYILKVIQNNKEIKTFKIIKN